MHIRVRLPIEHNAMPRNTLQTAVAIPGLSISRKFMTYAFDPRTRERGLSYYENGRIIPTTVVVNDSGISANVIGSKQNVYDVSITLEQMPGRTSETLVLSDCSCYVGVQCKHAAALCYFVLNNQASLGQYVDEKLPGPLDRWLKSVKTIAPRPTTPAVSDQTLLYLLATEEWRDRPRLLVSPILIKQAKTGKRKPSHRGYDFYRILNGSHEAVSPDDVSIASTFLSENPFRSFANDEPPKDPAIAAFVLQRIIQTGRAYWKTVQNPPLIPGAPRAGRIEWKFESDGRQRPRLLADGDAIALFSSHLWFVDEKTWESGPLIVPYSINVVDALLNVPPISHEHVDTVSKAISKLASIELPKPIKVEATERRVICPTPCLSVMKTHEAIERHPWLAELQIKSFQNVAMLIFDYGLVEFPRNSRETSIEEDGKLIVYSRDLEFELESIDWLKENGLLEAGRSINGDIAFVQDGGDYTTQQWWLNWAYQHSDDLEESQWEFKRPREGYTKTENKDKKEPKKRRSDKIEIRLTKNNDWWFNLDLGIDCDGETLSIFPILVSAIKALKGSDPLKAIDENSVDGEFVLELPDGSLLGLPVARVKFIVETLFETFESTLKLNEKAKLPKVSIGQALALAEAPGANIDWLSDKLKELAKRVTSGDAKLKSVQPPEELKATLRPYQLLGLSWLQFLAEFGLGGVLADDMGLGKTIQSIAHILLEKQNNRLDKPCLIVCPVSVIPNWKAEIHRFAPSLKVTVMHGADRHQLQHQLDTSDIILTSYPLLVRDYETSFAKRNWHLVILDEAQAIKNPITKVAKSAYSLLADHKICLTGTPVENNLGELWSQFQFLMPGALGSAKDFAAVFRQPIERHGDSRAQQALNRRTQPFMLRRTKKEVASELPDKTEIIKRIDMETDQRDFYETLRVAMHRKVLGEISSKGLRASLLIILDAMLKLRQACCDPSLVKLDIAKKVTSSAKLETLIEMLTELNAEGRKTLVFSQFTSMLDIIAERLKEAEIDFVQLRGSTRDRETPVRRFQNGEVPVFLISLKAGGTGLNLTAADTVIHYDPWWNPAVENQATDRAHRIGQDKNVFVYKLICQGTIEERVLQLQDKKRRIADAAFAGCANGENMPFDEETLQVLLG